MPKTTPRTTQTEVDRQMLSRAKAVSLLSQDPKSKIDKNAAVGAAIAFKDKLLAQSANVIPRAAHRLAKNLRADSVQRYHFIEHAERAAIFSALLENNDLRGATMYCTRFPCSDCARAIVLSGISRLVVSKGFGNETRWGDAQRFAREFLKTANVRIRYLPDAK